ncbi:MAG: DegV family protein [Acidimicrobiia bacterium]|nr:DegV family protein [Acidimicrobiia bacterium]
MIGLLTDSSSQLPANLRDRYDVEVVPITVTVDGCEHREGVDLDAEGFYELLTNRPPPVVKTAQPSPGEFVEAYERLTSRGADQIVAVLVGSELSGCVNSATVAAELVDSAVHVIDTGTASFGISACLWELAALLEQGLAVDTAIAEARALLPRIHTSVLLQGLDFVSSGGRVAADLLLDEPAVVYTGVGNDISVVGAGSTAAEIDELLLAPFTATEEPIRAAVCLADPATVGFCEALETGLAGLDHVVDITRYRVGPSIAAHTGPGTAGGFFWPALVR